VEDGVKDDPAATKKNKILIGENTCPESLLKNQVNFTTSYGTMRDDEKRRTVRYQMPIIALGFHQPYSASISFGEFLRF